MMEWAFQWGAGLLASVAFGGAAHRLRTIDGAGFWSGVAVGTASYGGFGPGGFLLLAMFFILGSGATRLGRTAKEMRGVFQSKSGRRTTRHVLANGAIAAFCGIGATFLPEQRALWGVAFTGSLAAATADTLSSEIGQAYGGTPYLLTTFRPVRVGENGGVTMVGTLAGAVGALGIALAGWQVGIAPRAGVIVLGGLLGNLTDSLFGATLERRGLLTNAGVNFACTLTGAALSLWLQRTIRVST